MLMYPKLGFVISEAFNARLFKTSLLSTVFLGSLLVSFYSYSAKDVDIYNIETLVVDQSDKVRSKAASRALETVFVRLSGSQSVLTSPAVKEAIATASIYVSTYSYEQTDQVITIAGAARAADRLQLNFSPAPIKKILKSNRLPVWLSNRPDILVWGAFDNGDKTYMASDSTMARALKQSAARRGLPITNPVLDLDDRSSLSVSRLWAFDEGSIRTASSRYDTNAILAGRFNNSSGQWSGNMLLLHQDKTKYFSSTGSSQHAVARSVIDQVTDYLASIYTATSSPLSSAEASRFIMLQVNNVRDFDHYASVVAYVESLPLVDSLDIAKVHDGRLLLKANLNSSINRLMKTIDLDKKLTFIETTQVSNVLSVTPSTQPLALSPSVETHYEFVWQE